MLNLEQGRKMDYTVNDLLEQSNNIFEKKRKIIKEAYFSKSIELENVNSMMNRMSNSTQGYIRHPVVGDGDCGYTAFGITREEASSLLRNHINSIREMLQLPVEEALLTEEFYNYLHRQNVLIVAHHNIINEAILRTQFSKDLTIQLAYIQYDICDKCIDAGWAHPKILQALAYIRNIELHMWVLGSNDVLIPHRIGGQDYSVYRSYMSDQRIDLLFVNGNHFDRLEYIGYENKIPEQGIYPLISLWSQNIEQEKEFVNSSQRKNVNFLYVLENIDQASDLNFEELTESIEKFSLEENLILSQLDDAEIEVILENLSNIILKLTPFTVTENYLIVNSVADLLAKIVKKYQLQNDNKKNKWYLAQAMLGLADIYAFKKYYNKACALYCYVINVLNQIMSENNKKYAKTLSDIETERMITLERELLETLKPNEAGSEPYNFHYNRVNSLHRARLADIREKIRKKLKDEKTSNHNKSKEILFIKKTCAIYSEIENEIKSFLSDLTEECAVFLGPPPCEYALVGFGSLARGEATPYSDIEFCILIKSADDTAVEYFRKLVVLLHFKIICLGESILPALGVEHLNNYNKEQSDNWFYDDITKRGFSFDGVMPQACKTPLGNGDGIVYVDKKGELICTPESLAEKIFGFFMTENFVWAQSLMSTTLIKGSQELLEKYREHINKKFDMTVSESPIGRIKKEITKLIFPEKNLDQESSLVQDVLMNFLIPFPVQDDKPISCRTFCAYKLMEKDIDMYSNDLFEININKRKLKYEVKKGLYRLPSIIVDFFAMNFKLNHTNTWFRIDELLSSSLVSSDTAHHLSCIITIAAELRLRVYLYHDAQKESLLFYKQMDQKHVYSKTNDAYVSGDKALIMRYYYSLLPLIEMTKNFLMHPFSIESQKQVLLKREMFDNGEQNQVIIATQFLDNNEAKEVLKKLIIEEPRNFMWKHLLSLFYKDDGEYSEAIELLENNQPTLEDVPLFNYFLFYKTLGNLYYRTLLFEKAINCFKHLEALIQEKAEENQRSYFFSLLYSSYANAYASANQLEKSAEYDKKVLALHSLLPAANQDKLELMRILFNYGSILHKLYRLKQSLICLNKALLLANSLFGYQSHEFRKIILNELEEVNAKMGRTEKAIEVSTDLTNTINYADSKLSIEDARSQIIYKSYRIGIAFQHSQQFEKAIDCQMSALDMAENTEYKVDYSQVSIMSHDLGNTFSLAGKYLKALEYFIKAHTIFEQHLLNDCHLIVQIKVSISNAYLKIMQSAKALPYIQSALEIVESGDNAKLFTGTDKTDVYRSISGVYCRLGDQKNALNYGHKTLSMLRGVYGNMDHPEIASSLNDMGNLYMLNEPYTALEYFQSALQMKRRIYGSQPNIHYFNTLSNLGSIYMVLSRVGEACSCFEELKKMMTAVYGEKGHPKLTKVDQLLNVAKMQIFDSDEFARTVEEIRNKAKKSDKSLEEFYSDLLENDPEIALMTEGEFCCQTGDYVRYSELLSRIKTVQSSENGSLEQYNKNMSDGYYHSRAGQFEKALYVFRKAEESAKKMITTQDNVSLQLPLILAMNSLGITLSQLNQSKQAIQYLEQSFRWLIINYDSSYQEHINAAGNHLAELYSSSGDYQKSVDTALEVFRHTNFDEIIKTMTKNSPMFEVQIDTFDVDISFSLFKRLMRDKKYAQAIAINQFTIEKHNKRDNITADLLSNSGLAWIKLNCPEKAIELLDEALDIQKHHFGFYHEDVYISLFNMLGIYIDEKNREKLLSILYELIDVGLQVLDGNQLIENLMTLLARGKECNLVEIETHLQPVIQMLLEKEIALKNNNEKMLSIFLNCAYICYSNEDINNAIFLFRKVAFSKLTTQKLLCTYVRACFIHFKSLLIASHKEESQNILKEIDGIFKYAIENFCTISVLVELINFFMQTDRYEESLPYLQTAMELHDVSTLIYYHDIEKQILPVGLYPYFQSRKHMIINANFFTRYLHVHFLMKTNKKRELEQQLNDMQNQVDHNNNYISYYLLTQVLSALNDVRYMSYKQLMDSIELLDTEKQEMDQNNGDENYEAYLALVHLYYEQKNLEKTIQYYKKIIQLNPEIIGFSADNDAMLLHMAVRLNHVDICQLLLERGVIVQEDEEGLTALHYACWNHVFDCAQLLSTKIDVNILGANQVTPLHLSVINGGSLEIIEDLIIKGANLSYKLDVLSIGTLARIRGVKMQIDFFEEKGINFNSEELKQLSPIKFILMDTAYEVILRNLIDLGVDLSIPGASGQTWLNEAVNIAAKCQDISIVESLLKLGVDPRVSDQSKVTPLMLAKQHDYNEAVELLEFHLERYSSAENNLSSLSSDIDSKPKKLELKKNDSDSAVILDLSFQENCSTWLSRGIELYHKELDDNENVCSNLNEALEYFEKVLQQPQNDRNYQRALFYKAKILSLTGQPEDAMALFGMLLNNVSSAEMKACILGAQGIILYNLQLYQEASYSFQKSIEFDSNNEESYKYLDLCIQKNEDLQKMDSETTLEMKVAL